jgi:hypothetical protein
VWNPYSSDPNVTTTLAAYADESNQLFGTEPIASFAGGTPYSLTLDLTFHADNASSEGVEVAGDALLTPVPEPNTLLLTGMGLVVCGVITLGSKRRHIGRVRS